jgi:hypothetical protein
MLDKFRAKPMQNAVAKKPPRPEKNGGVNTELRFPRE